MSRKNTAILWDIDGTMAPFGDIREGLTSVPTRWGRLMIDPTIVRQALQLAAAHFWFSNRDADDGRLITDAVGLDPLELVDTWTTDEKSVPGEWSKAAAVRKFMGTHGYSRVVIVDDEARTSLPALFTDFSTDMERIRILRPDPQTGVSGDLIKLLRATLSRSLSPDTFWA